MKIYVIKFKTWHYDEYDGFVIAAKSKKEALKLIEHKEARWVKGYILKELKPENYKIAKVILHSFIAG